MLLLDCGPSVLAVPTSCLRGPRGGGGGGDASREQDQGGEGGGSAVVPADVGAALRRQALSLGASSWPAPELRVLGGAGGLNELQRLLLPAAQARPEELAAMHPTLAPLAGGAGELSKVAAAVLDAGHDDATFVQWAQSAGVVVTPMCSGA
eukprot:351857-Chlamydomonas_euryale.AAC.2